MEKEREIIQRGYFTSLVIKYKMLYPNFVFGLGWILLAAYSIYLLRRPYMNIKTVEGFAAVVAAVFSLLSSISSFRRVGGPYIYMHEEYMVIRNGFFNNHRIFYKEIQGTTYKNQIIGLVRYRGKTVSVILSHLTEENQRIFLENLKNRMDYSRGL